MKTEESLRTETPRLDHVHTSRASRRDAHEKSEPAFDTYRQEQAWLVDRKREVMASLSQVNAEISKVKVAFSAARLAREAVQPTDRYRFLKEQRASLCKQQQEIDTRISRVKKLAHTETLRSEASGELFTESGMINYGAVGIEILRELRDIRALLEERLKP